MAKPIDDLDTGNYDNQGNFITAILWNVSMILNQNGGVFWLIYSDISVLLGL